MIVEVEEVEALYARLRDINSVKLEDITWVENGTPLQFTQQELDNWKFCGISNTYFVRCHKEGGIGY